MLPPNNPIKKSFAKSFFDNCFSFLKSFTSRINENRKSATIMFFAPANKEKSIPLTPNLLIKIDTPDIMAVPKTNDNPLLFIAIFK